MNWLVASVLERFEDRSKHFCQQDFKPLFASFVDAFVDSVNAGGPAAPCTFGPDDQPEPIQHALPAVKRLFAIGDVHGDLNKLYGALTAANLIDDQHRWTGGDAVAVQVGDQLDRGDQELAVLYALERLHREAARVGGAVHVINGNHETMNVEGNFRYATSGANASFARWHEHQALGAALKARCSCHAGWSAVPELETGPVGSVSPSKEAQACRWAALRPGGFVTRRFFARHPTVLKIGSTLFVHGGLHPGHLEDAGGLQGINAQTQEWMFAAPGMFAPRKREPRVLRGADSVVWSREYSATDPDKCNCGMLRETLARVGASRMVVGHTIQEAGVNGACDGQVVRVDVGMSKGCGNHAPEVLEIVDDKNMFRVLQDGSRVPLSQADAQWSLWRQRAADVLKSAAQAA